MRKIFFVAMILLSVSATCFALNETPKAVIEAFNLKFSNASKVKWNKENSHEYEASFVLNGLNCSANYSDTGEWLETENSTTFNLLPEKVQIAFNALHKGAKIKEIAIIETSKGVVKYEVEIKKCIKIIELLYAVDGKKL
ncbi:MAG: PepSY-like domain-containing protein [Bacteroidota bacterium]